MGEQTNPCIRVADVHVSSSVTIEDGFVDLHFFKSASDGTSIAVDRATAARLINQLRRALDEDYNRAINERAGGSDDYVNQHAENP